MTTIPPFAAGSYTASRNTSQLLALKSQLSDLTNQLSSGLTSQTYGGLGGARTTALSAQASISALNGYSSVIDTAQTRAKLGTTSLSQVVSVASATNSTLQNGLQSTSLDTQAAKSTALNNLNAALDALNQSDGSVYLFGGKKGSTQPVADAGAILYGTSDGTKTLDGLETIVQQQVDADIGPNGDGRVTQTYVANSTTISLAEGPSARVSAQNGGAFGFQLTDVKASGTAIGVTPASPSGQATLSVNGQPVQGDTVTVKLTLPDNTTTTITLTAAAATAPTSSTTFTIGATPSDTAKNLNDKLSAAIKNAASTSPVGQCHRPCDHGFLRRLDRCEHDAEACLCGRYDGWADLPVGESSGGHPAEAVRRLVSGRERPGFDRAGEPDLPGRLERHGATRRAGQ
ncbi:hypothetical protein [Methylobacterium komagatae]